MEDAGWDKAANRYQNFLRQHKGQHILYLELGVGENTPGIIKYPFWNMTHQNANATYACVNLSEADIPAEIKPQSIGVYGDIGDVLREIVPQRQTPLRRPTAG